MDLKSAAWLMFYMLVAPHKIFRNFRYRKHAVSGLVRKGPAFLVLFSVWLLLSSEWFATAPTLLDAVAGALLASTFLWYACGGAARRAPAVRWRFGFPAPLAMLRCLRVLLLDGLLVTVGSSLRLVSDVLWLCCVVGYAYASVLGCGAAWSASGCGVLLPVYVASLGAQLCVERGLAALRPRPA